MYYGLKNTIRLRREEPCVFVFPVDDTASLKMIHPLWAMLLSLCDGQRDRFDLGRIAGEIFNWEESRTDAVMDRFLGDFTQWLDASPGPFTARVRYQPSEFMYQPQGDPSQVRLSRPIDVAWLVTERCPYQCIYCCVKVVPASVHPPGEMSPEQSMRFLEDSVASGVVVANLYGGEPFLRPDLPELIGFLIAHDVYTMVSTKLKLAEATVARLAEVGLDELQVSIDSADPEIADRMVVGKNYLPKAFATIDLLQRYGLRVMVNAVVTGHNIKSLPALLRLLASKGVAEVTLARYLRSHWKHHDSLFPLYEDLLYLRQQVDEITAETGLDINLYPLKDPRQISLETKGFTPCTGGQTGLAVRADGKASFCDRLLAIDGALVGDVTRSTVMEIWRGETRTNFLDPSEESLAGTECGSCSLQSACNTRMRCYYRTFLTSGRLYGSDHLCSNMPEPPIRFS